MATRTLALPTGLTVSVDEQGTGTPVLLLHGGAGPSSVTGFATLLAEHTRVITPTHPGFDGQPRPDWFESMADLAEAYLDLLDLLDLRDVLVVGNSIGGWLAAEMALRDNHGRVSGLVLLNAVGIPGAIADAATMSPAEFLKLAWLTPPPVTESSDAQRAAMAANQEALRVYAGEPYMHDPGLPRRLHRITVPVLIGWGEHDGVVPPQYGRAYADLLPDVHFELIAQAGHLPHIEQAGRTLELIQEFISRLRTLDT